MKTIGFDKSLLKYKKTMQQDSPIPMQDDSEKQPPSNATEIHDQGLENVFKAILKQDANKLKAQLNQIELEKTGDKNHQDNEQFSNHS